MALLDVLQTASLILWSFSDDTKRDFARDLQRECDDDDDDYPESFLAVLLSVPLSCLFSWKILHATSLHLCHFSWCVFSLDSWSASSSRRQGSLNWRQQTKRNEPRVSKENNKKTDSSPFFLIHQIVHQTVHQIANVDKNNFPWLSLHHPVSHERIS